MCICIYMSIILCRNMCTDIFSFYAFIMKNKVLLYLYCMFYNCVVFVIVNKKNLPVCCKQQHLAVVHFVISMNIGTAVFAISEQVLATLKGYVCACKK